MKTLDTIGQDLLFYTTASDSTYSEMDERLGYPLTLSYLVLIYATAGQAQITVNFKKYTLTPHMLLVVSESDMVIMQQTSADFSARRHMVDRAFASDIAFDLPNHLFSFLHQHPVLKLNSIDKQQLDYWDLQHQYINKQGGIYQQKMHCKHYQNLFLAIAATIKDENYPRAQKFSRKEELCWRFWDLIGSYAKQYRDVAFYADQLCITPYYLSQISKDFLGYAPKELINRQVILEIKHLLKSVDKSIYEIAQELNFEDPSYMGRYFRRETKQSLTEFRRNT